jgi:NADH-quinone oxidoreductase subunit L
VAGVTLGWLVYQRKRLKAVEPELLAQGWRYDSALASFMGGPGRRSFDAAAWADKNVVDAAVNGTARGIRSIGSVVRKAQTGLVRTYAAAIGVGAVLLLVWFVIVRGVIG